MLSNTATSSPRDDDVDANPDLARKKQRLSQDNDEDSAPEDAILIEACEPEDIGVSFETAIEIEDDENMAAYSESFHLKRRESQPFEQISGLYKEIASGNFYVRAVEFQALADCLIRHCNDTKDDTPNEWRKQYFDVDHDFFSALGHLSHAMLGTWELFEAGDVRTLGMKKALQEFFVGIAELSCRIISLLPETINFTLSRRDSILQSSAAAQHVELSEFLSVALRALPNNSDMAQGLQHSLHTDLAQACAVNIATLSQARVIDALGTVVKILGGAMRLIKNSWAMLQDALKLLAQIIKLKQYELFPARTLEDIMHLVQTEILPAVCAKHPGALSDGFHSELIDFGHLFVTEWALGSPPESAIQAHARFVKSDEDAILNEGLQHNTIADQLTSVSGGEDSVLAQLLANSWAMQASIAYVRSDIMNVRSLGLTALTKQLEAAFAFTQSSHGLDHVHIQHAVRFLRRNEVTKYIFSSDSHASLISESSLIIAFLTATSTYTDQETDVIWRACSTSVEADFVKASFGVLRNQLDNLDFGHVLYIFKKYETTPIDGLDITATEFLPLVMQRLDQFHGTTFDQTSRLQLAFSTIDILKHVDMSSTGPISERLRKHLHTGVIKFTHSDFTAEDRREIYARLSPDVAKLSSCGTTAARILTIMLSSQPSGEEAHAILSMLPVSAAVDDLQGFVASLKGQPEIHSNINAMIIRFNSVVRLMSIDTDSPTDSTIRKVFDSVFGKDSLGEISRGAAWDKLHALTAMKDTPPAAINLWRTYMQRYVPSLPTALASSKLVELMWTYLKEECQYAKGPIAADFSQLLQHPLWATLKRFATTSRVHLVIDAATSAMAQFLVNYAAHPDTPDLRIEASRCQRMFVRELVDDIRSNHDHLSADGDDKELDAIQTVCLLHALLLRGREFDTFYAPANEHDLVALDSAEEGNMLSFIMHIYGAESQPQVLSVQAAMSTSVSDLLSRLPSETGASAHRIIAGGREITARTTQSLVEAGVRNSGVIQIRPRYKHDFDFDHLLRSAGPLEREIVAQFDTLESLLDGSTSIADSTVNFLRLISPTNKARLEVTSSSARAEDLFPQNRPARAQYSIYVLDCHRRDCARIGVADTGFLSRGARLLSSVLMAESRPLLDSLTLDVLRCLHAFFQGKLEDYVAVASAEVTSLTECPTGGSHATCLEDGAMFSTRMMDRLFEIEGTSFADPELRKSAASSAYAILILASQIDSSAWQHISTSTQSIQLHARLLLQPDPTFAEGISQSIRSLCQNSETPRDIPAFFWRTLMACLPAAVKASTQSLEFFRLAPDVLVATDVIINSESAARSLIDELLAYLWAYKHTESANDLLMDHAMAGLLRLLGSAVSVLRSFKKPLRLDGVSSRIAEQLLLTDGTDPERMPVVHRDTRSYAYDLMRSSLESSNDFERIVSATAHVTERGVCSPGSKFPSPSEWQRRPVEYSGLSNLGMTCYMNSMLQQLYGNIPFRKFVLNLPMHFPEKQLLLRQMQNLFAKMQDSTEPCQDTAPLANVLGVQIGNQEDVHDFYASLLARLEDEMPDSDTKLALSKFFTGQSITQIRGECGHVSSQKEAFGDLSVTVKNKPNLHDSLAEFVQGEPMEGSNKYKCMSCDPENGRLVDAMRRTCLEDVPDCLTICLKRFTFGSKFLGEGKVNDRFDFPESIDMSTYKRTHLEVPDQPHELDIFQLVGVIVHQGSLNLGHYWSYVRVPNANIPGAGDWFYLEDSKTLYCPAGFESVQQECSGGQRYADGNERLDNAYVLFYQRRQYSAEAPLACKGAGPDTNTLVGLPKVPLREPLAGDVCEMNRWRQSIADLFDKNFSEHVCWLLNQYPSFKETVSSTSDSESSPDTTDLSEASKSSTHVAKLGAMMANFALRVLISDPLRDDKLSQTTAAYKTALEACPSLAQHILEVFLVDAVHFEMVFLSDRQKVLQAVFRLLTQCFSSLREQDQDAYWTQVNRFLDIATSLRERGWLDRNPHLWADYFAYLSFIAKQGPRETKKILDSGCIVWVVEIIFMPRFARIRQARQHLWNRLNRRDSAVDFEPLFHFLHDILCEYVDLSILNPNALDSNSRTETGRGWSLTGNECRWLTCLDDQSTPSLWMLYSMSRPHCRKDWNGWKEFGLGKVLGLLVSNKADSTFKERVVEALAVDYEKESHDLAPLVYATLHYCANNDDKECNQLISLLTKTLHLWPFDRRSLEFLSHAFALAPRSVVESTPLWAERFVREKKAPTRRATADWLKAHIFVEETLSDDQGLDSRRANVARLLANSLASHIKRAYDREQARNEYESAMDVVKMAASYIESLAVAVEQAQRDDVALTAELLVQYNEAAALLPRLDTVLEELADWESEAVLPMRIQHSVEIEETDVSEDELEELDDFEDLSQSL